MRKYKGAVVTILVLAILLAVYFFVTNYMAEKEQGNTESGIDYESYYTSNIEKLTRVKTTNDTGTFTFVKGDGDEWSLEENKGIELVQSSVVSFIVSMTFFDGELIEGEGYNPADYGLDKPSAVVELTDADGTVDTITVGNLASTGEMCYVTINGGSVYSAFSTKYDNVIKSLGKFRPTEFYTFDSSTLNSVKIVDDENGEIFITAKDPTKNDISLTGWQMTKPYNKDVYNSTLGELMVDPLAAAVEIVEYISDSPTDLAQYGLANPHEIVTIDTDTQVVTLLFGNVDGENVYVMKQGFNSVYLVANQPFEFRNVKAFDYINKLVNLVNIKDLDNLKITAGTEEYVIDVKDGEFAVNKKSVKKEKVTSFYESLMLLSVRGVLDDVPTVTPAYVLEYNLSNGTKSTVKFIPYKERFYAAWVDGAIDFYVNKADVESVIAKLAALEQ